MSLDAPGPDDVTINTSNLTEQNQDVEGSGFKIEIKGEDYDEEYLPDLHDKDEGVDDVTSNPMPNDSGEERRVPGASPTMGKPCGVSCRKRCNTRISEDRRKEVFSSYMQMSSMGKRSFIFYHVSQHNPKRPTTSGPTRRGKSLTYTISDEFGEEQDVCKTFFLTTLGYHPKNDRLITTVISNSTPFTQMPPEDRRGKHEPHNKLNLAPIHEHIESFNPIISHDQREHAPVRRYLPSDVTVKTMYSDYLAKSSQCGEAKCSYETYRKEVKRKNISFTRLGEEQCEHCLLHDTHVKAEHDGNEESRDCLVCATWEEHKRRVETSKQHYRRDAEREPTEDTTVRSVDPQKIIMLPRMPGVKVAVFTRRITAFHETFATVSKKSGGKRKNISVVWHEGIASREAEEVASAYVAALRKERDVPHVVYWMDNCATQNKNWCLLTTLVSVVNDQTTAITDVTLKYFEPGHTFMSADSVEQQMKRQPGGVVLDFDDFKSVVASSNSGKVDVVELHSKDILGWQDGHTVSKLQTAPHLADMAQVQFRRGSREMWVKLSHDQDEFTPLNFLEKNFCLGFPMPLRSGDKGVEKGKKEDIIKNLCPLMPPTRQVFWRRLAEQE